MIILTILLVAGLHSLILYLLRKRRTFFIQILASIGILYLFLGVLPQYYMFTELDSEDTNCNPPSLIVYFLFFLFGIGSTVTITILFLLKHIENKKIK